MKIALLFFVFFSIVLNTISLNAMSWPSSEAVLVRNFGANNDGTPALGMAFAGETDVVAVKSGEVIFSRGGSSSQVCFAASRLPSPLGAWTAVDHGDGLISIYSRYNSDCDFLKTGLTRVEREQPIASAGISGWSERNGFYFKIFDREERRWVNPVMILTPMRETLPPQIFSVELRDAQGFVVSTNNITQGRYTIIVNAAGGRSQAPANVAISQLAPHRIVSSVNGSEAGSLNFEAVFVRDGVLMVSRNGLVPARQVYTRYPAFEVSEVFLTRGQVNLEIIVQDINGISRSIINRFVVN
ncbi:MAG: M23 family metallopeptidase [Treponema sp.]|nr:M23 family metallopeptidase [Treponema sp.]